jgi:energy-coupling factor transporter ATP-binding protein EcfA2
VELAAAQRRAEQRATDAQLAAQERAAREAEAARAAVEEATRACIDAMREVDRLRAEREAAEAAAAEEAAAEAARCAAEEEHLRARGFNKNEYNFVVVGPSGSGKSTFINSVRGLYAEDVGAAKACCGAQTTMESARYPMPGAADNIVFWDEPGGDTMDFPAETYFERRCLRHFDCILMLYNNRFTAVMSAIIPQAYKHRVPVFLVYTKMGTDVRNEQMSRRRMTAEQAEASLRERVRDDISNELHKLEESSGVRVPSTAIPVYFIDSLDLLRGEYRFDEKALIRELVRSTVVRRSDTMTVEELFAHIMAVIETTAES